MAKEKKRWGDRKDAYLVRDQPALNVFMPHLMPNRTDCEAFINETIDLTNINAYLAKKNSENPVYKYTYMHVVIAAIVKTIVHRPRMNRFISGRRMYQRKDLSVAFVAKKQFSDDGEEALLTHKFGEEDTIDTINNAIYQSVTKVRTGGTDNTMGIIEKLAKLPTWMIKIIMGILKRLDYHGWVPTFMSEDDPDYATVFLSNLGSIGLNCGYHHLANWGNNSIFVVIGKKRKEPEFDDNGFVRMREVLNLGLTLDERLADGYYYSKTVKMLLHLLQNPELLEIPAKEPFDFE